MKTLLSLKNKLTDYYPYGEPWREPAGQPWLYSGNERLREDGINEYDFNARRYNSALGMFTTWDPLAEKRPWDSPYSFCAGDPVNFSDPTGEKYRVDVDTEHNTITISATYFTFDKYYISAKQAINFWNNQNFIYQGYSVIFNLHVEVVPFENGIFGEGLDAERRCLNYYVQISGDEYANYYMLVPRVELDRDLNVNGTTNNYYQISVSSDVRQNGETGAHEVGHSLGLGHSRSGLMTASSIDRRRTKSVSIKERHKIIKQSLKKPKKGKGRIAEAKIGTLLITKLPKLKNAK